MWPLELTQGLQTAVRIKSWSLTLPELPHTLYVDICPQVSPGDNRPYPLLSLCLDGGTALHVRKQKQSPVGLYSDLHFSGLCSLLSWKCFRKGQNIYISNLKPPVHTFLSQNPPGHNEDRSTKTGWAHHSVSLVSSQRGHLEDYLPKQCLLPQASCSVCSFFSCEAASMPLFLFKPFRPTVLFFLCDFL